MADIKIENVVASSDFKNQIPLNKLTKILKNSEYEPEQFPGLVYRLDEPRVATLIFSSGKIICVGARSTKTAEKAVKKVASQIKEADVKIDENSLKIKIENIVAAVDLGKKLNLDELAFNLEESEYEPEQFPGLVYRVRNPKLAFLLFTSGRVVCAGGKTIKTIKECVKNLETQLSSLNA